jgi:hypothetical protein
MSGIGRIAGRGCGLDPQTGTTQPESQRLRGGPKVCPGRISLVLRFPYVPARTAACALHQQVFCLAIDQEQVGAASAGTKLRNEGSGNADVEHSKSSEGLPPAADSFDLQSFFPTCLAQSWGCGGDGNIPTQRRHFAGGRGAHLCSGHLSADDYEAIRCSHGAAGQRRVLLCALQPEGVNRLAPGRQSGICARRKRSHAGRNQATGSRVSVSILPWMATDSGVFPEQRHRK